MRILLPLLFFCLFSKAQTEQIYYYSNLSLNKEVAEKKAKYSESISRNEDGSLTTKVKDLKQNRVISSKTYKGEEPFGVWLYKRGDRSDVLDYAFDLKRGMPECKNNPAELKDFTKNNDSLQYTAPMLEGDVNLYSHISKHIIYPESAIENGISGKVFLAFTITEKGEISDVYVISGLTPAIDKEAARVVRELPVKAPARLKGQPLSVCFQIPIVFKMM
jgi:TonB family protein